jgi:RNA processing factor Prp31
MVVQAIALLDDLDKEINIYSMRVKEWYGWHFPELAKIVVDNQAYAKVVREMGASIVVHRDAGLDLCPTRIPNKCGYYLVREYSARRSGSDS